MIRPPPRPPLFPSPPLFRSEHSARAAQRRELEVDADDVLGARRELGDDAARATAELDRARHLVLRAHRDALEQRTRCVRAGRLDRKSTRLNSSHLVISYAVF